MEQVRRIHDFAQDDIRDNLNPTTEQIKEVGSTENAMRCHQD